MPFIQYPILFRISKGFVFSLQIFIKLNITILDISPRGFRVVASRKLDISQLIIMENHLKLRFSIPEFFTDFSLNFLRLFLLENGMLLF